jgi:hypothetical protein
VETHDVYADEWDVMTKLRDAHDGDYDQLDKGTVEYKQNEVHVRTSYDDPAGVSLHNDYGNSLGKLSGKHKGEEHDLVQFKRNAKGGEIYVGVLDQAKYEALVAQGDPKALDHAMIEVMNVQPDGIEFRVPVKYSAGTSTSGPQQITTKDGRYLCVEQNDGNFVVYDKGVPVWDRWSHEAQS